MNIRVFEVVKVLETEEIKSFDDEVEPLVFRIEILSDGKLFWPRLYCWSTFRIPPTFVPNSPNMKSIEMEAFDKQLLTLDQGIDWRNLKGQTADEAINLVLRAISKQIAVTFEGISNSYVPNESSKKSKSIFFLSCLASMCERS